MFVVAVGPAHRAFVRRAGFLLWGRGEDQRGAVVIN